MFCLFLFFFKVFSFVCASLGIACRWIKCRKEMSADSLYFSSCRRRKLILLSFNCSLTRRSFQRFFILSDIVLVHLRDIAGTFRVLALNIQDVSLGFLSFNRTELRISSVKNILDSWRLCTYLKSRLYTFCSFKSHVKDNSQSSFHTWNK